MSDSLFDVKSDVISNSEKSKVYSVEDLNRHIRQLIEGQLSLVWVQGEISNFKAHSSGHFYFSLKDAKSQISAVMFRGHNSRLKFNPTDGMEVIVRGRVTVYEPRGNYQITCETMEPVGAGALQKAFEQLKLKLKNEGLFDPARKRPLPSLPRHIAIVTSPTGAAIRDILNILSRRNRSVQVTLVPTVVQGEAAAPKIVEALKLAYQLKGIDAIILGRGGGSTEDMWCFNDETLARTIVQSPVPVISAVGHEIDFTISDFVADLRAPTPSAAAELVVKNTADLLLRMNSFDRLLKISIEKVLRNEKQALHNWTARLVDPKRKLQDLLQRNDELAMRLQGAWSSFLNNRRLNLQIKVERLKRPDQVIADLRARLKMMSLRMESQTKKNLELQKSKWHQLSAVLDSISPLKVVERGYSVTKIRNKVVKSTDQVKLGDELEIQLGHGSVRAEVKEILKEK